MPLSRDYPDAQEEQRSVILCCFKFTYQPLSTRFNNDTTLSVLSEHVLSLEVGACLKNQHRCFLLLDILASVIASLRALFILSFFFLHLTANLALSFNSPIALFWLYFCVCCRSMIFHWFNLFFLSFFQSSKIQNICSGRSKAR